MQKLVMLSNIAAPYQVKFCYALSQYFDAQFWFYEQLNSDAGSFWTVPLGDRCRILPKSITRARGRYTTTAHLPLLSAFDPDIVMLGGFSIPANYLAYRWAKTHGKKVVVLTERSRTGSGRQRRRGLIWRSIRHLYRDVDAVFALSPEAYSQFRDDFGFGDKVVQARYAADLNAYAAHPDRTARPDLTLLFANRLVPAYNPLAAIEILRLVQQNAPGVRLHLNGHGVLRNACEEAIRAVGLEASTRFLDDIPAWDHMHEVYREADVLLLPAQSSSGNFTIYEAMASGMGLVISDQVLGTGMAVENGRNGFRLPLDPAAHAAAVLQYIEEPALLTQHAAINRPLVQPLGMQPTAALYHRLLHEMLAP